MYIVNRSPTRANEKIAPPLEVLTGKTPYLREIVVFGSPCNVYRDLRKNSLLQHLKRVVIVGVSEKTKGYKVLLSRDSKAVVTQHLKTSRAEGGAKRATPAC